MESSRPASVSSPDGALRPGALWVGSIWRNAARWRTALRSPHRVGWRSELAFDRRAFVMLATAAALAGAVLGSLHGEHSQRRQSDAQAREIGAEVEAMLDRVDLALTGVEQWVRSVTGASDALQEMGCPATLSTALIRLSLEAPDARGVGLQHSNGACGPLGSYPGVPQVRADDLPVATLLIETDRTIGERTWMFRRIDAQAVAFAELDALALQRALRLPAAAGSASLVALRPTSGDDGSRSPSRVSGEGAEGSVSLWRSPNRPVAVRVRPNPSARAEAIGSPAVTGAIVAVLLAGAGAAWRWNRLLARVRLSERIARGLRKRQFEPFVQPQVAMATGRCVGAEVLARWRHPIRGLIGPGEFIEEAERSGLVVPMTEQLMRKAAQRLAAAARADRALRFAFNITPADLCRPGFVGLLNAEFHADTIPREQVVLELTERDALDEIAQQRLVELRAAGWKVAIDDFGTGHSSLALLERLRVDELKIDQAFVRTVDAQTVNRPVLDAITALGRDLSVPLLAEGVETATQAAYLTARGVQHAQGYHYARPMPIEAFERWLLANAASTGHPLPDGEALARFEHEVVALGEAMRGADGVCVRDRRWRARVWPQCFVGREAVDWIVRARGVPRARAVQLGRALTAFGLLRHVAGEHDFEDAMLFYRWVAQGESAHGDGPPVPAGMAAALRGPQGVALGDHRRGLAIHRGCASGRAIVDWIAQTRGVSRDRALRWGEQLMREGRVQHVLHARPFRDDRTLYRLI